ncbi:ABC transporter permease [Streptomyces netropsis]|uniref:ABC transporter permease n=1 Tax=Streptomyces netropsis TaxID=55404 RepID=UPI0037A44142
MSAATAAGAVSPRFRPRGMTWLVWRQHRATLWIALGLLVALVGALVWVKFAGHAYLDDHGLRAGCEGDVTCGEADWQALSTFRARYGDLLYQIGWLTQYLPWVVGLFVAGPMVARELESGTYKLAWSQSASPLRWLAAKLATVTVAALAGFSLLSAVHTWTWQSFPTDVLTAQHWQYTFDMIGPAPVAHALLAIALGTLVGLLVKRTIVAMGVTLVLSALVIWALDVFRPYVISPVMTLYPGRPSPPDNAWVVERGGIGPDGGRIKSLWCDMDISDAQCLAKHGLTDWYAELHPRSHLWPMQWAETGILVGVALVLAAAAVWLLRHRSQAPAATSHSRKAAA